jgi:hypothetical protein
MIKPDHDAEAIRRRDRTQQGRSPAQRTSRSEDKGRSNKRPGKGQRRRWRKLIDG